MERTIRVTGKGKLSVKPDMIRLRINIEGTYEEYDETLRRSSDCVGILKDLIGVCQVKCVNFFDFLSAVKLDRRFLHYFC